MRSYSCDAKEGSSFLTEDDIKELDLEKCRLNMESEVILTVEGKVPFSYTIPSSSLMPTEFYILIVEQERNEFGRCMTQPSIPITLIISVHCLPQDFERPRPTGRMDRR